MNRTVMIHKDGLFLGSTVVVFLLFWMCLNALAAPKETGEYIISPEHDRQLEKLIDPDGFKKREQAREQERLQKQLLSGEHTKRIPRHLKGTENYDAYNAYMMYRQAVEGIEAAKSRISERKKEIRNSDIGGNTLGGVHDRVETRKIMDEQRTTIEEMEKRRDYALAEWNKKDYGKTFGNLEKGIHNKVMNPVTREETDIIGINIGQRKRLDPEKQKFLDWMNSDPRTVLIMINGLPEGHPDKEGLKHLVTHDRSMEALTIIESLARDKYIDFEKLKDDSFIIAANEDDPYIRELRNIEENKKIDKIMESYRDEKQKEAEKKKPGIVSIQKTGDTNTSGMKTVETGEEPKNDAGSTVSAGTYEQGDRIVTRDGTEYENKGGQWVKTGSNYGTYEPTDGKAKAPDTSMAGGGSVGQASGTGHSGSKLNNADSDNDGKSSGLDWAQNINVTKSYKDGQRSKSKSKAKENLKNSGLTTSERLTAGEAEDQRKKGQISSQGQETGQNISNTQQEGKKAQDMDRIMSETSIGTILAGGLMGGLSAGVATGLDGFFGTLGQGAGSQVSVSTGIQPPPPPKSGPSSGTDSSTEAGSSNGTGATTKTGDTTTAATPGGSGTSAEVAGSIGTGTSKGTGASNEAATSGVTSTTAPTSKQTTKVTKSATTSTTTTATVTKPTTAATKPTTSATKTTTTGVSKPDCSQYRISAENLTSQYEQGAISTSAYQVQMRILRTKYKGCNDAVRTPNTTKTTKTATKGYTGTKDNCKWICTGWDKRVCCAEWKCNCPGGGCDPNDPQLKPSPGCK